MGETPKANVKVLYAISQLGGPRKGHLTLCLEAEQPGPVYAEFISIIFFIPIVFARHVELPVVDKINIDGKEFFMLRKSGEIIDYLLEELKESASHQNEQPESYSMTWTWELPSDISSSELEEARYIKWNLLACVEPTRLRGKIEKAPYSSY